MLIIVNARVEAEWLTCKNLQVSGRNLQSDASPCKFFFQKLASYYKLSIFCKKLVSSYKLTSFASSYKLTICSRPGCGLFDVLCHLVFFWRRVVTFLSMIIYEVQILIS